MKITHFIATSVEGTIDEVIDAGRPDSPTLTELIDVIEKLAFIAETVAHMHHLEKSILPITDAARSMLRRLNPEE